MKKRTLFLAILLLGAAGVAAADQDNDHRDGREFHDRIGDRIHDRDSHTVQAPEIDPASLVVALTLLGGAMAVLRGRRLVKLKG
jgi:hypothetical protein